MWNNSNNNCLAILRFMKSELLVNFDVFFRARWHLVELRLGFRFFGGRKVLMIKKAAHQRARFVCFTLCLEIEQTANQFLIKINYRFRATYAKVRVARLYRTNTQCCFVQWFMSCLVFLWVAKLAMTRQLVFFRGLREDIFVWTKSHQCGYINQKHNRDHMFFFVHRWQS